MLKLYKFTEQQKEYWETWENDDGTHEVHWGQLGTEGESKTIKSTPLIKATDIIQKEVTRLTQKEGFHIIPAEKHFTLLIEYAVDGFGNEADLEKRHRLEQRMNQTLGWAGLGACDGGSIGSNTMEVCNYVVDFELSKQVIAKDLAGTEFENYTRIYDEDTE